MTEFVINNVTFKDQATFIRQGRRCATPEPNALQANRISRNRLAFRALNSDFISSPEKIIIPIRFIHIVDGVNGQVSDQQRKEQVQVLNDAFGGFGFRFEIKDVVVKDNPNWFRVDFGTLEEVQMKRTLQEDPTVQLNFYTANPPGGTLGWATFPWEIAINPDLDGVVLLNGTLPGGNAAPFNLGHTATHEIGHWLGLFHTFQGGCNGIGDVIGDTIAHSGPNFGTPDPDDRNGACSPSEKAPVRNFMNYVDDSLMTEFTLQQQQRMRELVGIFRPKLIDRSEGLRSLLHPITPLV